MNAVVQLARQNKAEDPHVSSMRTLRFFFFFFFSASSCSFRFLLARSSSFAAFAAAFAAFASCQHSCISDPEFPRSKIFTCREAAAEKGNTSSRSSRMLWRNCLS